MSNRINHRSPTDGKTHISLANGAVLAVDQTPEHAVELINNGKLGSENFVKFTVFGLPTYLSKESLNLILMVYVPPSETVEVAKGDVAAHPALRR